MESNLYVHGDSKPRKRFFVMDEARNGDGDSFIKSFFSKDEAVADAVAQWNHLTAREKRDRRIFVGHIGEQSIPDDVLGERSIIGDVDLNDWDSEADENWPLNFSSGYTLVYECGDDEDV